MFNFDPKESRTASARNRYRKLSRRGQMTVKTYIFLFSIGLISFQAFKHDFDRNGYVKYKYISDSIFKSNQNSESFSFQHLYNDSILVNPRVSVLIGRLFNKRDRNAIIIYSTSDSTLNLDLYSKNNSTWDLTQSQPILVQSTTPLDRIAFLYNINGDKINDLILCTNMWQMRSGENYKAFLFKKDKLFEINGFENFTNPLYDNKTKKIHSYFGTGCADMTMLFLSGYIRNDSLLTESEIYCDCCIENNDSCEITINKGNPFKVKFENSYKYVQPFYQAFLKHKLEVTKKN